MNVFFVTPKLRNVRSGRSQTKPDFLELDITVTLLDPQNPLIQSLLFQFLCFKTRPARKTERRKPRFIRVNFMSAS